MKFAAIEAKFTAKVAEYIGKGYTINATTMRGGQGEIAKVDFRKGGEIIRVMLIDEYNYGTGCKYYTHTALIVGRNTKKLRNAWDTIWNNELETVEREEWVKVSDDWYLTVEEAAQANAKAKNRLEAGWEYDNNLGDKAAEIVLSFARRQKGCKRCKVSDIIVRKTFNRMDKTNNYVVYVNGNRFIMH